MSEQTTSDDPRRQRLEEVIGAFLVAVDAGHKPDPNEWLARHGDLYPELAEFFADLGRMDKLVEPVKPAPSQPLAEPTMSVDSTEEGTARVGGPTRARRNASGCRAVRMLEMARANPPRWRRAHASAISATTSWEKCWAKGAWGSSTRLGSGASIAPWP